MPKPTVTTIHLWLMLSLTFSTGIIDAVGYLGLDRVFTGNMTGNIVILGMALAGADDLPILGPLVALAGFMLGAAVAGRVLRPVAAGWTHRTTTLFAVVGVMMGAVAVTVTVSVISDLTEPVALAVTAVLGLVMGLQAAAARHLAVKDVTTVVVTSTITGFAADSRLGGGSGQPWARRLIAIAGIGAGAGVGALTLQVGLGLGIALSAVITIAVAVIGHTSGQAARVDG